MASQDDIARVAGPESMAHPEQAGSSSAQPSQTPKKKNRKRGGKKKSKRPSTYNAPAERAAGEDLDADDRPSMAQPAPFYRLQAGSHSNSSLESEALLDHRDHSSGRPRRKSLQQTGFTRPSLPFARHRSSQVGSSAPQRSRLAQGSAAVISEDEDEGAPTDRTPLLSRSRNHSRPELARTNSGNNSGRYLTSRGGGRRSSVHSHTSSRKRVAATSHLQPTVEDDDYDVNNPPSVPTSPVLGSLDDMMINTHDMAGSLSERGRDAIIDIDESGRRISDSPSEGLRRRTTVAEHERDVCFPADAALSEIAEEDRQSVADSTQLGRRRTRGRHWPDLSVLEEWSREEKEERTQQEHIRAKKINEPVMIGGRLRPGKTAWHREVIDEPFRFTYYNETFDGTIHARTISDLLQEGATFKDLFLPDPVELESESEDEDEDDNALERPAISHHTSTNTINANARPAQRSRQPSMLSDVPEKRSPNASKPATRSNTPSGQDPHTSTPKPKRYGARPTFWLDVLEPTEMEMKVLAKAFGIHQLTTEDILMQEQREKVELFSSYYFINYRSFEQDKESEDYMDPVNFYAVVFRDGIITFHHSQTPHPANVRRRTRQLSDYMSPTADWISYALIDDITDVYAPRVTQIEEEVDEIDEEILYLHVTSADDAEGVAPKEKEEDKTPGVSGGDMLRRVGECRKKVMGLYRLLGNKADVIKGFAKRCNESWEVAPRSEIGLYLGDIQDHIVTMNNNLSHYENLLSRAHSNYVAQINIRMNERAEKNADILGKLTVIGTIVLPMNIITGMWGMNVYVPWQVDNHGDNVIYFWIITAGLFAFGISCFFGARRIYGIV